jgi:hypothetical protein
MNQLASILDLNTIAKLKVVGNEIIINSYDKEYRREVSANKKDVLAYLEMLKGGSKAYINSDVFGFNDLKISVRNFEYYTIHEIMIKALEIALDTLAEFSIKEEAAIFIHSSNNSQINKLTISAGFENDIPVTLFELSKYSSKSKSQGERFI